MQLCYLSYVEDLINRVAKISLNKKECKNYQNER